MQAYTRTRGKELPGNYNSALLAELFHEQSSRWPSIAASHVHDILDTVSNWIQLAVERLHPDECLKTQILAILQQWLESAEKNAFEELARLIEDEGRTPLTYNHYYTDNVQKARMSEQRKAVADAVIAQKDLHGRIRLENSLEVERFLEKVGTKVVVDMDEQACNEAITQLDAYYKVGTFNSVYFLNMLT
jgi:hypothetical protein